LLNLGPMLWFLKYFRRKFQRKKLAFLTENKAKLCKNLITLVFEKNVNFFAENSQKSQKIVIITSTPAEKPLDFLHLKKAFTGQRTWDLLIRSFSHFSSLREREKRERERERERETDVFPLFYYRINHYLNSSYVSSIILC
jgi:hypothetical protein